MGSKPEVAADRSILTAYGGFPACALIAITAGGLGSWDPTFAHGRERMGNGGLWVREIRDHQGHESGRTLYGRCGHKTCGIWRIRGLIRKIRRRGLKSNVLLGYFTN